ncbi:MAG: HEPN domain-containing protein [Phycisphaerales bacterium]
MPAPDDAAAWLAKAQSDPLCIRNNLASEEVPTDAVCFHAQQAGEKALKALIAARGLTPERTHDLTTLINAASEAGWANGTLVADADVVNPYSVAVRYPGVNLSPTLDEARRAAAAAASIVRHVASLLPA